MNESVKNRIKELYNNTPKNIGVMYGKKTVDGEVTGENCIVFTVPKKIKPEELNENEILPKTVEIDNQIFNTDVLEVGEMSLFGCGALTANNCYDWNGGFFSPPYYNIIGVPANKNRIRPLQGGISLSDISHIGLAGTLGFIAVDKKTQAYVGVSCNHSLCKDGFYTSYRDMTSLNLVENEIGDFATQSGETQFYYTQNVIGDVIRYVPLNLDTPNKLDAGLISIYSSSTLNELLISAGTTLSGGIKSWQQYGLTNINVPPVFATTAEIDALLSNPPTEVMSSGRSTGPKQGNICGLSIFGLQGSSPVSGYNLQGNSYIIDFEDLIIFSRINPDCPNPAFAGDSGSALLAMIGGTPKIIGIIMGGGVLLGLACRIDILAEELDIEAWDGTPKNHLSYSNKDFITIPGGSHDKTIVCSGETYWQIGASTDYYPCDCNTIKLTFNPTSDLNVYIAFQSDNPTLPTSYFNMTVDWGDGNISTYNNAGAYELQHTYSSPDTYEVLVGFSDCGKIKIVVIGSFTTTRTALQNIEGLESLPNLITLSIYNTTLVTFNSLLPSSLQDLIIWDSRLTTFNPTTPLPPGLQVLNLTYGLLTSFDPTLSLPPSLIYLNLESNLIQNFTPSLNLPLTLSNIYLNGNPIDETNLNNSLIYLDTIPFTSVPPKTINLTSSIIPSTPSGAGLTAKNNLISEGWFVTTQ